MAEKPNSTVLTVQVGGANVDIDSIAKAKKAIKDLNSEVLKGNQEALKSLADVKDRLEDVKEATNTVKGSGVEKLTSSFGLLSQGFTSFDSGKITAGFKGIGAAMSAIPIFLLIQGITLLIENFDQVIDFVTQFTGSSKQAEQAAINLTQAIDAESEALKNLLDISSEVTKTQLLNAKLQGASEQELTAISRQAIESRIKYTQEAIELLVSEYNQLLRNDQATTERLKNAGEELNAAKDQRVKLGRELENFDIQTKLDEQKRQSDHDKELLAKNKENAAKLKAQRDADAKALNATFSDSLNDEIKFLDDQAKEIGERQKQRDADRIAGMALIAEKEKEFRDQSVKEAEESSADSIKLNEQVAASKLNNEKNAFQGAKDLNEAFLNFQLAKADGDIAKQNEAAKKAFQVNKALQLAQGGLEAYRSVLSTYAATPGGPIIKGIAAGIAGVASAAMLLKIASVKFKGQDVGGAAPSINTSAPSIASTPPPPQLNSGGGGTSSTIINNNGSSDPLQAFVVEGQSRAVTDRINRIRRSSTFG